MSPRTKIVLFAIFILTVASFGTLIYLQANTIKHTSMDTSPSSVSTVQTSTTTTETKPITHTDTAVSATTDEGAELTEAEANQRVVQTITLDINQPVTAKLQFDVAAIWHNYDPPRQPTWQDTVQFDTSVNEIKYLNDTNLYAEPEITTLLKLYAYNEFSDLEIVLENTIIDFLDWKATREDFNEQEWRQICQLRSSTAIDEVERFYLDYDEEEFGPYLGEKYGVGRKLHYCAPAANFTVHDGFIALYTIPRTDASEPKPFNLKVLD